jgi:hypothetical protein
MAVFQIYVQGAGDLPPDLNKETDWSRDILSVNAPLEHDYDRDDIGKIAHYRAHLKILRI